MLFVLYLIKLKVAFLIISLLNSFLKSTQKLDCLTFSSNDLLNSLKSNFIILLKKAQETFICHHSIFITVAREKFETSFHFSYQT